MTQGEAKILGETYFNRALLFLVFVEFASKVEDMVARTVISALLVFCAMANVYRSYQFERMSI
jgi:hypothetical protein